MATMDNEELISNSMERQPICNIGLLGHVSNGKCLGEGTLVLTYDGFITRVEKIKVGDLLVGDDFKSRTVMAKSSGLDFLYKIRYKTNYFRANRFHILTLYDTEKDCLTDISVSEYIKNKPNNLKHIRYIDMKGKYELSDMEIVQENKPTNFYGFELSGNGRFLLGDLTITHNSSLVNAISDTITQRFADEIKTNMTLKLGYANAKIFKCSKCPRPSCYQTGHSNEMTKRCKICDNEMELQTHVSFIDAPGHNSLIMTMLNGTCIMDHAIIVESANNQQIPSKQTEEHLAIAQISNIDILFACMNKLDTVQIEDAYEKINEFDAYTRKKLGRELDIIPISANLGANIDVVCEYICQIPKPIKRLEEKPIMVIIRSYNNNRQSTLIQDLVGGSVGGSLVHGIIKLGDKIIIKPGIITKLEKGWECTEIVAYVKTIFSDNIRLAYAIPGGLISIGLSIDPSITAMDHLSGNILMSENDDTYKTCTKISIDYTVYDPNKKLEDLLCGTHIYINCNACCVAVKVVNIDPEKHTMDLFIKEHPICVKVGNKIMIMCNDINDRIIGIGIITKTNAYA